MVANLTDEVYKMTERIRPVAATEYNEEVRAALGPLADRDPLDNVFATFARHPRLFKRFSTLGSYILERSTLTKRQREIAILRIGYLNKCEYEFSKHNAVGLRAGLTPVEIASLLTDQPVLSAEELAIVSSADALHQTGSLSDSGWQTLRGYFSEQQCMDIVFTIGTYNMVSWALNAFGVQLDAFTPRHPWVD